MAGIDCSIVDIERFIGNADNYVSAVDSVCQKINEAFDILVKNAELAIQVGEKNLRKINEDIFTASYVIRQNNAKINTYNDRISELQTKLKNLPQGGDPSSINKDISNYSNEIARINNANIRLNGILNSLQEKHITVENAVSSFKFYQSSLNDCIKSFNGNMCGYKENLNHLKSVGESAKSAAESIGKYLSFGNEIKPTDRIKISSSKLLSDYGNSLTESRDEIAKFNEHLTAMINSLRSIMQSNVTDEASKSSVDSLKIIGDQTSEFNNMAHSFYKAAQYLSIYEDLK